MGIIPDAHIQVFERRNARRNEANEILGVGQSLRIGYLDYLDCTSVPPTISPRETTGR